MIQYFCLEILGESLFHPVLMQSGWSGKDYFFHFNPQTQSHMRAYASIEEYRAERVDMHKAENIWPLLGNMLPREMISDKAFAGEPPRATAVAAPRRGRKEGGQ